MSCAGATAVAEYGARRLGASGATAPESRLARRLGLGDAVVIGLGAMIGAGVFAAFAPAAAAAGPGLLLGLAVAGAVAYANATSSAKLAALYPESGGTYAYGRRRLGPFWGFLAGWAFVVGKVASCAAMALTFGNYAAPSLARPLAVAAVVAVVAVDYRGVDKTAAATRAIVAVVLASLAAAVVAALAGGQVDPARVTTLGGVDAYGVLQSAAILFFAFAGYARVATLGEEVRNPARVIPLAVPIALAITLVVYAAVGLSALAAVGAEALARSPAPLVTAVEAGSLDALAPAVRVGAAVASLGVLLSLLAGIGRTAFAMAANGDLPAALAAVHPRFRVPHRAGLVVGAVVAGLVAVADLRDAIAFSSFAVLLYYALANASALTLTRGERRGGRLLPAFGAAGCVTLAATLPPSAMLGGAAVLAAGGTAYLLARSRR